MSIIRKLKRFPIEPEPQPTTPRCCAQVQVNSPHDAEWRKRRYGENNSTQCTRPSVVEISGKNYCRLHGGHVALDMVLRGDLIEKAKETGQ